MKIKNINDYKVTKNSSEFEKEVYYFLKNFIGKEVTLIESDKDGYLVDLGDISEFDKKDLFGNKWKFSASNISFK